MTEKTEHNGHRSDARSRLLEATIRTIQERGRDGATAREIAQAAHANLGAIVYYYGSKDALVDQALVAASERWADTVRETGFASGGGKMLGDRIASSLGTFLGSLASQRSLASVFLEALASADRSPTVRSALADSYEGLRQSVVEGAGENAERLGLGFDATEAAAGALVALFDGLLIQWLLDPDRELNAVELVTSLASLLGTALAGAGSSSVPASSVGSELRRLTRDGRERAQGGERSASRDDRAQRRRRGARRGDVVRLGTARRGEAGPGHRYAVLLQSGEARDLPTVLVAPISRRAASVSVRPEIELGGTSARVLVDRLRAVRRSRLEARVGRLSGREQNAVDEALASVLALD